MVGKPATTQVMVIGAIEAVDGVGEVGDGGGERAENGGEGHCVEMGICPSGAGDNSAAVLDVEGDRPAGVGERKSR